MAISPFFRHFPDESRHVLSKFGGQDFLESISGDDFLELISGVLNGENPRNHFETRLLTETIVILHRAIQEMYEAGRDAGDQNFIVDGPINAARWLTGHFSKSDLGYGVEVLKERWRENNLGGYSQLNHDGLVEGLEWGQEIPPYTISPKDRKLCFWLIGSTQGKGWQGQFGKDRELLLPWAEELSNTNGTEDAVIAIARHAGSLSKKGGSKSMMGNLLEDPVLFSALRLCGLEFCGRNSVPEDGQFTLDLKAAGEHQRQADAAVRHDGSLIYFDIGWVNEKNPELTADKMQRFEQMSEADLGNTIIVISQAAEGGEVRRIADESEASLIVMDGNEWVNELNNNLVGRGIENQLPEINVGTIPSCEDLIGAMKETYTIPEGWD